jgi:hypothetical protein
MTRYRISIDEIVLDGLGAADAAEFRSAFAAALGRLAAGHSGEWTGGEAPLLHGAAVSEARGDAVAASVWRAIAPAPGGER